MSHFRNKPARLSSQETRAHYVPENFKINFRPCSGPSRMKPLPLAGRVKVCGVVLGWFSASTLYFHSLSLQVRWRMRWRLHAILTSQIPGASYAWQIDEWINFQAVVIIQSISVSVIKLTPRSGIKLSSLGCFNDVSTTLTIRDR